MFQAVWLKRSSKLELERAPVHLLAVVNRMDLASVDPVGCQNDGSRESFAARKSDSYMPLCRAPRLTTTLA